MKELGLTRRIEREGSVPHSTRRLQELWLLLSKRKWTTLTVLPVDSDRSTRQFVCALADAGTELSDVPLSAVTSDILDAGSARVLSALARQVKERREEIVVKDDFVRGESEPTSARVNFTLPPLGRLIISVPSVKAEPVALAVANAADMVILGIEMGRTKKRDVRRSIDLIGRKRIGGCVLL